MKNIITELKEIQNITVCENISCKQLTTFKVGGECTAVFPQNIDAFIRTLEYLKQQEIKHIVLGNGSNVVFSDNGYDGIVVVTTDMKSVCVCDNAINAECGAPLHAVCTKALDNSLCGVQFAYGIPGTVGGAVFMNAGAYDGEIKDVVKSVKCYSYSDGKVITLSNEECGFAYRYSDFQNNGLIVLSAEFVLKNGNREQIKAEMTDIISRRKDKQPLNYPSAGSAFKRYPGKYTAKMIDEAGLKGYKCGGAQVSEKHAGFIVNVGGATCENIKELVDTIKREIKLKEGIDIECEIRFIE